MILILVQETSRQKEKLFLSPFHSSYFAFFQNRVRNFTFDYFLLDSLNLPLSLQKENIWEPLWGSSSSAVRFLAGPPSQEDSFVSALVHLSATSKLLFILLSLF